MGIYAPSVNPEEFAGPLQVLENRLPRPVLLWIPPREQPIAFPGPVQKCFPEIRRYRNSSFLAGFLLCVRQPQMFPGFQRLGFYHLAPGQAQTVGYTHSGTFNPELSKSVFGH